MKWLAVAVVVYTAPAMLKSAARARRIEGRDAGGA
jgi:hypothetical protein